MDQRANSLVCTHMHPFRARELRATLETRTAVWDEFTYSTRVYVQARPARSPRTGACVFAHREETLATGGAHVRPPRAETWRNIIMRRTHLRHAPRILFNISRYVLYFRRLEFASRERCLTRRGDINCSTALRDAEESPVCKHSRRYNKIHIERKIWNRHERPLDFVENCEIRRRNEGCYLKTMNDILQLFFFE